MLSQKNQAADTWTLLQVSQICEDVLYVQEIPKTRTNQIRVLSFTYLRLNYFSDRGKIMRRYNYR
jgi:hypothetical protein